MIIFRLPVMPYTCTRVATVPPKLVPRKSKASPEWSRIFPTGDYPLAPVVRGDKAELRGRLSFNELYTLDLRASGLNRKQIATKLFKTRKAIDARAASICLKLGLSSVRLFSQAAAVLWVEA